MLGPPMTRSFAAVERFFERLLERPAARLFRAPIQPEQLQRKLERLLAERHPGRFVPRYAMVSFMRLPYATAFERGQAQRALLVDATRGRSDLDDLDWDALDRRVREALSPLPTEA